MRAKAFLLFVLVIFCCPSVAVLAQSGKPAPPPPPAPANDYSPKRWVRFTSEEGKFEASFPGQPKLTTVTTDTTDGKRTTHIHQYGSGRFITYAITYSDFSNNIENAAMANKVFDNMREQWKATLNVGRLVEESNLSFANHPARFFHFDSGKAMLRAKAVIVGNRIYLVAVGTPVFDNGLMSKNGHEEIANAFLEGFVLTEATPLSAK